MLPIYYFYKYAYGYIVQNKLLHRRWVLSSALSFNVTCHSSLGLLAVGDSKAVYNNLSLILLFLEMICCQKLRIVRIKTGVSGFGTREGMLLGGKASLTGKKSFAFIFYLIELVLSSIRMFSGFYMTSITATANFNFGIYGLDRFFFGYPELRRAYDVIMRASGLDVSVVFYSVKRQLRFRGELACLLSSVRLPFRYI